MTKKQQWKTAAELMAELHADPEFCRQEAEREQKWKAREERYAALEQPVIEQLRTRGYVAQSIGDAINKYAPLPESVVEVLLDFVLTSSDDRLLDWLVRALGAAATPFDGRLLVQRYQSSNDEGVKWAILNTIALARPHSIDEWIERALKEPSIAKTLRDLGYRR